MPPPAADGNADLGTLVFQKPGELAWRLQTDAKTPVRGARVRLSGPDGARAESKETVDSPGRYVSEPLVPGAWQATAVGAGFQPQSMNFTVNEGETIAQTTLVAAATTVRMAVTFPAHPDRGSFAFCRVRVTRIDKTEETPIWREHIVRNFDDAKARRITESIGLPPGRYRIDVRDSAFPWKGSATFQVIAQQASPIQVTVRAR